MPETLTDEQILNITDDAPEVSSEASETSGPIETDSQETEQESELSPTAAKDGTLPTQKPTVEKPQDKTQQAKPADQNQDAATYQELFPQGIEQAREVHAKARELDRADQAFSTSDYQGMAETFEQVFADNPHGCAEAVWMGMRFLEDHAPQELAQVLSFAVSEELGKHGVWDWLENAFNVAQASPEQVPQYLQQLAGFLNQKYGLGPASTETQEASWQNYTTSVGALMEQNIDADIRRAFGERFSSVQPKDQEELLANARFAVRDLLEKDPAIGSALQKLFSGYSAKAGMKVFLDVIDPKARAIVPGVVQHLTAQYKDLFKQAAPIPRKANSQPAPTPAELPPSSHAEARARGWNMARILKATQSELGQADADNVIGREEAAAMSPLEILHSPRRADLSKSPSRRNASLKRSEARNMSFREILDDERPIAAGE